MVAAEAIKNVSRNLVTSIREPENIGAMSNVAFWKLSVRYSDDSWNMCQRTSS